MGAVTLKGVRLAAVAAAVPQQVRTLEQDAIVFGADEVRKVSDSTGVKVRHVSAKLCTTDLCFAAAEKILAELPTENKSIDALIFVSQTPDHVLPASACTLQDRLGLPTDCAAFDINLGCSGYVYGLWVAAGMIAGGAVQRVLLLAGDTISHLCSPEDRSVALLFGDAGTATLLERDETAEAMHFVLGTDGRGKEHLKVEAGGFRTPLAAESTVRRECEGGNKRSAADLYMNGAEVFSFTLKAVPALVRQVLDMAAKSLDDVDAFVPHQANRFMLDHLSRRMKIPPEKLVLGLEAFGNTSSASIPLALVTELGEQLRTGRLDLLLAGFGVGYSWAGVNLVAEKVRVAELVIVPEP